MDELKIIDAAVVVATIFGASVLLWYIFGDSPTLEQLLLGIVTPIATIMFSAYKHVDNKIDKINERLAQVGERLAKLESKS